MTARPAAGGGRWVSVSPERLPRWLAGFGDHTWSAGPDAVALTAADGRAAELIVAFPPLPVDPDLPYGGLLLHCAADRRVGVLLVRLGGFACGVFNGSHLVASKVGSRQVHGRSAAGGQSQQRFARRREGQVAVALAAAADLAVRVLLPAAAELDAVVVGGDRSAVEAVLRDRRLAALLPLVTGPLLDVPDPRLKVLLTAPDRYRAVRVRIIDPPQAPAAPEAGPVADPSATAAGSCTGRNGHPAAERPT